MVWNNHLQTRTPTLREVTTRSVSGLESKSGYAPIVSGLEGAHTRHTLFAPDFEPFYELGYTVPVVQPPTPHDVDVNAHDSAIAHDRFGCGS